MQRARIAAALVLATSSLLGCARPQPPVEKLYVSDERGDAVSEIDPRTGTLLRSFAAGRRPRGLHLSADGASLYVAVSGSPIGGPGVDESTLPPPDHRRDGIAVIDLASGRVARRLAAGTDPETFTLSPDGATLYVSNEDEGTISAVARDGLSPRRSAKVGDEPEGVAVTADGRHLFVACEASDAVAMVDAHSLATLKRVAIAGRPRGLLLSDDGANVFVTVENGGKLVILAAADGAVVRTIDLSAGDSRIRPMGMVEAGGRLYVTTGRAGLVLEVDPARGTILRRFAKVGARPWGIAATADQSLLVTANGPSNDVAIIDRASGRILRRIGTGAGPWGVAAGR